MEIDIKSFHRALTQIAQDRGIPEEKIIETLEAAIATAYKKDYGKKGQKIKAKFNSVSGDVKFWQVKLVVDKDMIYTDEEVEKLKEKKELPPETIEHEEGKKVVFNLEKHIMIEDAKKEKPKIKTGEELEIPLQSKTDYGRIAAQTAKQVILQKIREVEKEAVFGEYKSKEGEITSGVIQRIEGHTVFVDIGKTLGVLSREEQIPGEFYRPGQRLKFYILKVDETPKGPVVLLSRSYPKLISKLFELEVPEIGAGTVEIKSIAREPGFRTKIAVVSTEEGLDPIGSCVGQRGTRIIAVINELGGEKVDVVEWQDNPERFIANALAPAKILEVEIDKKNTAKVSVPEDQLSLAIGKDGRNVRLAANLTGWKVDIVGVTEDGEKQAISAEPEIKTEEKEEAEKKEKKGAEEKKEKEKTKKPAKDTPKRKTDEKTKKLVDK
ncbi:transcription termination factor NusA [Patescibacteria group bacterium]|nr:transcription termination factor NusA [Patescibacteria group bacterium]